MIKLCDILRALVPARKKSSSMTLMQHSPKLMSPKIKLHRLKWFLSNFWKTRQNISKYISFSISLEFISVSVSTFAWRPSLRHERDWFQVWPLDLRSAPTQPGLRHPAAALLCATGGDGRRLLPPLGYLDHLGPTEKLMRLERQS